MMSWPTMDPMMMLNCMPPPQMPHNVHNLAVHALPGYANLPVANQVDVHALMQAVQNQQRRFPALVN